RGSDFQRPNAAPKLFERITTDLLTFIQYARLIGAVSLLQSAPVTLTQHKINEIAAKCVTAQQTMSGLKGTKKPGETQEQFNQRIKSYLAALDAAQQALARLKQMPALTSATPDNEALWRNIVTNVGKLDRDIHDAREAWAAVPKLG